MNKRININTFLKENRFMKNFEEIQTTIVDRIITPVEKYFYEIDLKLLRFKRRAIVIKI